jgi:PIN domain of ribonuclease
MSCSARQMDADTAAPTTLAVTRFARATGDLHSLSAVDVKLLALAYTLEAATYGSSHLRASSFVADSLHGPHDCDVIVIMWLPVRFATACRIEYFGCYDNCRSCRRRRGRGHASAGPPRARCRGGARPAAPGRRWTLWTGRQMLQRPPPAGWAAALQRSSRTRMQPKDRWQQTQVRQCVCAAAGSAPLTICH